VIHDSKILAWTIPSLFLIPGTIFAIGKAKQPVKSKNAPVSKNAAENQGNGIVTIADAYQMAYQNNLEIQMVFNELKTAQEECFKVRAEWFPNIDVGAGVTTSPSKVWQVNNVGSVQNVQEQYYSSKNKNRSGVLNFTIAQNLYNGGATTARNEAALEAYRVTWCEFKGRVQNVFMGVLDAFVEMATAREIYLVVKMREKSLGILREVARNRAMVGDQRMVEVSLANAQCIRMSIDVNNAKQEYLDRKIALETLTGFPVCEDIEFPVPITVDLYSVQSFIDLCLKNNPFCQRALHAERLARCNTNIFGAAFLPTVGVSFEGSISDQDQWQDNSGFTRDNITIASSTGYTASIKANMPIFDGGARRADYRKAELACKKSRLESEGQKRDLIGRIKSTMSAYRLALQNVVSAREGLKEQGVAFSAAREEYALGATSLVDLLSLEDAYVGAIRSLIQALAILVKLSYQLKSLQGQLTPDMVHVKGKNYDILAYRKAFSLALFSLGDKQSKTSLYNNKKFVGQVSLKKPEYVDSVGSVLLKKTNTGQGFLNIKSALKEAITWYPAEGLAIQKNSDSVVDDRETDVSDAELEAVMNKSLDELSLNLDENSSMRDESGGVKTNVSETPLTPTKESKANSKPVDQSTKKSKGISKKGNKKSEKLALNTGKNSKTESKKSKD
jgi:outer membrane protein TolC